MLFMRHKDIFAVNDKIPSWGWVINKLDDIIYKWKKGDQNKMRICRCCNPACGWIGTKDKTVRPKHSPYELLCPNCREVT